MSERHQDDLGESQRAQDVGRINEWVQEFLRGSGGNEKLADTLLEYAEYCIGPVDYPLDEIINIIGPTDQFKFYEDEAELNARVDSMVESIKDGWRPAPLIVSDIWENHMEIADGGHRHRALQKVGYETYPTIIYFHDAESKEKFASRTKSVDL